MNVEIVEQKENPLLSRVEVVFRISHAPQGTPKREEVRERIATLLNTRKDLVIVGGLESVFGACETRGHARVYLSTEILSKIEPAYLLKRNGLENLIPKKKREETAKESKTAAPQKR